MYTFAKYLNPRDFEIHVLCPDNIDSAYPEDDQWIENLPPNIILHKSRSLNFKWLRRQKQKSQAGTKQSNQLFQKIYEYFMFPDKGKVWAYTAKRMAERLHKDLQFDLVFSSSPLVSAHQIARHLKQKFEIPWICEFRDFFFTNNSQLGAYLYKAKQLEKEIFNIADQFITVSPAMQFKYAEAYPDRRQDIHCILNGVDSKLLQHQGILPVPSSDSQPRIILYAGTFYNGLRNPKPLLNAMNDFFKEGRLSPKDWTIQIIGNVENHLVAPYKKEPLWQSMEIIGGLSRSKTLHYMQKADFFWLIVPNIDSHRDTIPAKIYEYLYFQKPILAFVPMDSSVEQLRKYTDAASMQMLYTDLQDDKAKEKLFRILTATPISNSPTKTPDRQEQAKSLEQIIHKAIK